ncbi:MAG: 2-hydroxyacyl-CoA dehydratase family protein [Desulfuromonadales bacterium]|nr:2-hydroxyacyl-CoA dehydratase family protein [Desulfuromonadales bacterium]
MLTEKLKNVQRLQAGLMADHYRRVQTAKAEGRPVAYVTAGFPVEIAKAFEPHLAIVYPENHAVMLITRGQDHLMERAEAAGLDRMGCAYELINTGYLLAGHGGLDAEDLTDHKGRPLPKLPEPDILLNCDNQCRVVSEWFKHLSEIYGNKPYKMINVGDRYDGSVEKERVAYVRQQLEELIVWLEDITGHRLDRDHLLEVADLSRQAVNHWRTYLDLGTTTPSPMTAFDGFSHMALVVSERGTPQAVDYYEKLVEATSELVDSGVSAVGTERHRLLWDNLPTWFNFRELQEGFAKDGIAVVGSTYLDAWRRDLDISNYDALLDSMARNYSTAYTNMTIDERVQVYIDMVEKFKVDGVLFHKNLGCHTYSLRVDQIARRLEEHFGPDFKTVVFEGCQGIKGRFQKHAMDTGVQVHFVEK